MATRAGETGGPVYSYELVLRSAASVDAVFGLLADGGDWASWGRPLVPTSRWYRTGTPPPGGVGAIRELGLRPVVSREEIVEYAPPRRMAYRLLSGIPLRDYLATVDLEPLPGGDTRITWKATFRPKIPGTGPFMRWFARTFVGLLARRLAAAAAAGVTPSATPGGPPR